MRLRGVANIGHALVVGHSRVELVDQVRIKNMGPAGGAGANRVRSNCVENGIHRIRRCTASVIKLKSEP